MRAVVALACAAACLTAGCGSQTAAAKACAPGRGARDVVEPVPRGYSIRTPAKPEVLEGVTDYYAKRLGATFSAADTLILARKGSDDGVAFVLISTKRPTGSATGVVRGAKEQAKKLKLPITDLTVAGVPGVIFGSGTSWFATAASGDCGVVIMIADTEKKIRDVAAILPRRG